MKTASRIVLMLTLGLCAAAAAQPTANIYLAQGKVFFQGMEFEKCLQRMEQAARWKDVGSADLRDIELYTGLCKFSLGRRDEAVDHFTLALQLDPDTALPAAVSPKIEELFQPLAERARTARPTAPPPAQASVQGTVPGGGDSDRPRRSQLTPQEGERQNALDLAFEEEAPKSRVLPLALGGTAVAAAGAGAVFGILARASEARFNDRMTFYEDARLAGQSARGQALAANVAFGLAGAAAVGAVVTWLADGPAAPAAPAP